MPSSEEVLQAAVASRLGPQAEAAAQAAQAPQAPQAPEAQANTHEMAIAAASPQTEDNAQSETPVSYEVKFPDGNSRSFTNEQLAGVLSRYPKMNAMHADMKPVYEAAQKMNLSPEDIVARLSPRSNEDKPTAPSAGNSPSQADQIIGNEQLSQLATALKSWEDTNAVAAPPGYAQIVQNGVEMQQAIMVLADKVSNMSQGAAQVAAATQEAQMANADNSNAAMQQRIANNLNMMQQQLGLPDEDSQAFEQHMMNNGLVLEDMLNMDLALETGRNFMNAKNAPEFERLQRVQNDRSAYTEQSAGTPSASGEPPQLSQAEQTLSRLTEKAMQSRV
ncbi:MAG: hypothetical protein P8R39_03845 [Alphaproteobacteria bacterium]|nr:hypothetical protein [Alphaproteobacteria bacterium]